MSNTNLNKLSFAKIYNKNIKFNKNICITFI